MTPIAGRGPRRACGPGCGSVSRPWPSSSCWPCTFLLTYIPVIQFLLLLVVTFHAALGLRVILLDFNLVGVKYQRALIWGLVGLGLLVVTRIWYSIY